MISIEYKKLIVLLSSVTLGLFNLAAQADTPPPLPHGVKPTAPYIVISKRASATPGGITPAQIKTAYGFSPDYQGAGETIAIIDSGDDPNIEADLNVFSTQFGLPPCTTANGCFTKLFADGSQPAGDAGWAIETSLDVEWAHAIAPQAKIILVETADAYGLFGALPFTTALKPSVISLSWGSGEFNTEIYYDQYFNVGLPIVAATGDNGTGVWYPAASPYVTAAGGTQISMDASGNYISETGWSGSGGGVSAYESEPAYQTGYVIPQATGKRGVPDVSYNASGSTAYAVYDSYNQGGWMQIAGTSAAAPQWAALIAVMKSAKKGNFANFNASIYSVARTGTLLHDTTTGTNGTCGYYCSARSGYDYVTGLGTPFALNLIKRFN